MAEFYYPNYQPTLQHLHAVPQGFYLEMDDISPPVLFLKFDAGILLPIINGCDIQLNISRCESGSVSSSLLIYDHPKRPLIIQDTQLYFISKIGSPKEKRIENIFNQGIFKIALFNEETRPVCSFSIKHTFSKEELLDWYDSNLAPIAPSENDFKIKLQNFDHTKETKFNSIINYGEGINKKHLSGYLYNVNEFLNKESGTHGYALENSIEKILAQYFEIDKSLFIAPFLENEEEYCDFVLVLEKSVIIIESKFVLSGKATKINSALKEGVAQIITSEAAIKEGTLSLKNKFLEKELMSNRWLLKILLYNDSINLTESRCSSLFSKFNKFDLPMFMSVTTFNQFLAALYIINSTNFITNLDINLWQFFYDYYSDKNHKFLIFENFDI